MVDVVGYELQHRADPPRVGLVVMAEDFGEGGPPVTDWEAEIRARLQQIDQCVSQSQADRCPYDGGDPDPSVALATYQGSMVQIMDVDIGPIRDLARECAELLPKAEPVPPDPTPAPERLSGVYGTYSGHGNAEDFYGGWDEETVHWGPHHDLPIRAPADGRVERYQFGTPLDAAQVQDAVYAQNWQALGDGWSCRADAMQTMQVCVFFPSTPMVIAGQRVGHVHYAHVRADIQTGAVRQGDIIAYSSDSGIRFEPGNPVARAAHTHCCAGAGTSLSPNGDLDGRLAILAQGWSATDLHTIPGPSDYQVPNKYCAGRLWADFQRTGRPAPPMPG